MSEQVSSGGVFPPPPPPASTPNVDPPMTTTVARRGNGMLTGAGVLQIIQGALSAIMGLWLFSVTQSDFGGFVDDLSGGTFTLVAIVMIGIAVALIWIAILCIKARKGGWVTTVVFQSIFTFFGVLAVFGAASEGDPVGGAVFTVVYCGVALFLAAKGGKQSTR